MRARAVIAEDEPLLAESLRSELHALWPELEVLAIAGNGEAAVNEALARRPDVVFLDIRMPGMSGLEAAGALTEDWPEGVPFPLLVFVTAYDQYALQAFERAAIDYVLKPVQAARLRATVQRLQAALATKAGAAPANELVDMVERLRGLLGVNSNPSPGAGSDATSSEPLRVIQAGVGNAIHMVPIDDVLYFEAADKYVRVITAVREHLIRTSLRDLLPRLDASRFWRIHRGTVIRAEAIASAERDENGHVTLRLQGRPDKLVVSRLYAHRFKAM
jgi:DNA-binding LytR/AlgR family response regulator